LRGSAGGEVTGEVEDKPGSEVASEAASEAGSRAGLEVVITAATAKENGNTTMEEAVNCSLVDHTAEEEPNLDS